MNVHRFNSYAEEEKRSYFLTYELWNDPSFRPLFKIVHIMSDVCSYWTQTVLLLAFGIERFILICKGPQAKVLLSKRKRLVFYLCTVCLSFLTPVWVLIHFYFLGGTIKVGDDFFVSFNVFYSLHFCRCQLAKAKNSSISMLNFNNLL